MGDKPITGGEEDKTVTTYRVDYTRKDRWDKFQSIGTGAIFSGILIALLGYFGTGYFNKKQTRETDFRLYSEIMNQREQADNKLRSEMFQKIFDSFLPKSENQVDNSNSIQAIKNDILSLELLTRNFHESIDIKPLFRFILFKIIPLKRDSIKTWKKKRMILNERLGDDCKSNELLKDFFHPCNDHIDNLKRRKICKDLKQIKKIDCLENSKTDVGELITLLEDYGGIDSSYKELFKVAGRIRRKQVEVLREMGQHLTIKVPMKDVCTDLTPRDTIEFCEGKWPIIKKKTLQIGDVSSGSAHKREFTVTISRAYPKWKQVRVRVEAKKDGDYCRNDKFLLVERKVPPYNNTEEIRTWFGELGIDETPATNIVDPETNEILMASGDTKRKMIRDGKHGIFKSGVVALPAPLRETKEIRNWFTGLGLDETPISDVIDPKTKEILMEHGDTKREMMKDGKTDIFGNGHNKWMDIKDIDTDGAGNDDQEFWVGAFDFPLVDSTYLSENERFSVVIEEIDEDSAKLILVYFPSKYTGLKEKSFYHQRVLNHLEKSEIFNE